MIKKCIGCGLSLQSEFKNKPGYTPNLQNNYCMRCFRLKNYGEKKDLESIDYDKVLAKVNENKGIVFFLIDYLNLNKETLNIFKKIKLTKILVISKSDILRRDMKFSKIKTWLQKVYNIEDNIAFISNKNNFQNINIFKYMTKLNVNTCYIMGITNAGKSTFINSILKQNGYRKEIVVSNKPNTTLDFIKLKFSDFTVYDTPGYNYLFASEEELKREIKPVTFNITKPTTVIIDNHLEFFFANSNKITIYTGHHNIKRIFKNNIKNGLSLKVPDNSDLVTSGLGFINIKNSCQIISNIKTLEIRPNMSGDEYE